MNITWWITSLVLAGLAAGTPAPAETASALLEKGIYAEETLGDLPKAIEIYRKIITEAEADRSKIAQAYFRLGTCFLKNGENKNAAAAFTKLIADYPEQKELVEQARKKLPKPPRPPRPVVIATNPVALADDVSPDLDKITVTFDRPMMDQNWSWTGGGETYPTITAKPFYDTARTTCTLPVKLAPGKVYWVGINSPSFKNFKTEGLVPAQRYVILFATKGLDGKATPLPNELLGQARAINKYTEALRPQTETKPAPAKISDLDKMKAEQVKAKAWQLWRQQKFPEAEESFKKSLEINPTDSNAWNGLGWAQVHQGMYLNAGASFDKCLTFDPKNTAALNGKGWIAREQNKPQEAIAYWQKAVEIDPAVTAPLAGLTRIYMETKQYANAAKYYALWQKVEPNDPEVQKGLIKALQLAQSEKSPGTSTKPVNASTTQPSPTTQQTTEHK